jgi:hypothetical protein
VEEVNVLGRGQALELELGQAPELEPLRHLGMQIAELPVLLPAAVAGPVEGDQVDRAHPSAAARVGDGYDDAAHRRRQVGDLERGAGGVDDPLSIQRQRAVAGVDIGVDTRVGRARGQRTERLRGGGEPVEPQEGGEQVLRPSARGRGTRFRRRRRAGARGAAQYCASRTQSTETAA